MYIVHTIFFSNNGLGFTLLEYSRLLMWLMLTIYLNRGPDKLSYSFETMVQRFFHYIGKKSSNSKPIAHSHLTFTRYKTFPFFHLHSPTEPRVKFLKNFFLFLTILACEPTCLHTQQKWSFSFPLTLQKLTTYLQNVQIHEKWVIRYFWFVKCISEISTLLDSSSAINMHIKYPK